MQQNRGSKTSEKFKSNFMEINLLEWNYTNGQGREILTEKCVVSVRDQKGEDGILARAKITLGRSCKDKGNGGM